MRRVLHPQPLYLAKKSAQSPTPFTHLFKLVVKKLPVSFIANASIIKVL